MYGCAMTDITVIKVENRNYSTPCYMGVKRDGIIITNLMGQLVLYISHTDARMEINE